MGSELRIAPLAESDIAAVIDLAGVIWRHHYPGIVSMEQIDYMLAQRYTPAVIRAQMNGYAIVETVVADIGRGFVMNDCVTEKKL